MAPSGQKHGRPLGPSQRPAEQKQDVGGQNLRGPADPRELEKHQVRPRGTYWIAGTFTNFLWQRIAQMTLIHSIHKTWYIWQVLQINTLWIQERLFDVTAMCFIPSPFLDSVFPIHAKWQFSILSDLCDFLENWFEQKELHMKISSNVFFQYTQNWRLENKSIFLLYF